MTDIHRTAYPRYSTELSESEIQEIYEPSDNELTFIRMKAKGGSQQLALLFFLKCHQHLGIYPTADVSPRQNSGSIYRINWGYHQRANLTVSKKHL